MLNSLSLLLAMVGHSLPSPKPGPDCGAKRPEMRFFVIFVRGLTVRRDPTWQGLDFAPDDSFSVHPVTSDSLCLLAKTTLVRHLDYSTAPNEILLVSAGRDFVAQWAPYYDPVGEFRATYAFDSTLTKVLFPCPDATAPIKGQECPPRKPK